MTVTEREDKEEASNEKIEEIKKEKEEEVGDEIDRVLKELVESDREFVNTQEQDGLLEYLDDLINKDLEELKRSSSKHMEESQEEASKRARIAEPEEAKTATEETKEEEDDQSDSPRDPLEITEEIIVKYLEFVDYLYQMLKEERQQDEKVQMQRWSEVMKRGKRLVNTLNHRLKRVKIEMECLENEEESFQKEYALRKTHIPDLLDQLRSINSLLERSPNISLVSSTDCVKFVLASCLDELEHSKEQLNEMIEVIKELKEIEEEYQNEETELNNLRNNGLF